MAGLSVIFTLIVICSGGWGLDDISFGIKSGHYEESLSALEQIYEANRQKEKLTYEIARVEELYKKGLEETQKAELLHGDEKERTLKSALDYLVAAHAGFKLAAYDVRNRLDVPYRKFVMFRVGDSLRSQLPVLKALKREELYESTLLGKNGVITSYREAIEAYPDSMEAEFAAFWVGTTLYMRGDVRKAAEYYRMVKDHGGSSLKLADDSRYMLGRCLWDMGDVEEAQATFESFLEDFPESALTPSVAIAAGDSYAFDPKSLPKRMKAYKIALKSIEEKKYELYKLEAMTSMLRLGEIYLELGSPDEAVKYLKPCVSRNRANGYAPLMLESMIKLSQSYIEIGDVPHLREAVQILREASKLAEDDISRRIDIASLLGQAYYELGQYGNAVKAYRIAWNCKRLDYENGYRLADSYFEIGDYDRALEVSRNFIERIADIGRVSPEIRRSLLKLYLLVGDIMFRKGEYEKAVEAYRQGAQGNFKLYALEQMAECYVRTGQSSEADKIKKIIKDLGGRGDIQASSLSSQ